MEEDDEKFHKRPKITTLVTYGPLHVSTMPHQPCRWVLLVRFAVNSHLELV
jgi:hypothetical protein